MAVKTVLDSGGGGALDLLREVAVMAQVTMHETLVGLIGVVTQGTPLLEKEQQYVRYVESGYVQAVIAVAVSRATKVERQVFSCHSTCILSPNETATGEPSFVVQGTGAQHPQHVFVQRDCGW